MPRSTAAAVFCRAALVLLVTPAALVSQQSPPPTVEQGVRLFDAKQYDQAAAVFRPLAAGGKNAVAEYWLGRIDLQANRADDASTHLERAVALDGAKSDYHLWLGNAYGTRAQKANMLSQAMLASKTKAEFERAVELDPHNIDARSSLMQYYLQAPSVMGGSKDKAREQVQAARQADPYRGTLMAITYGRLTKDTAAVNAEYRTAMASYPDSVPIFAGAVAAMQDAGRHGEAAALVDKRLKSHPDDALALFLVGRAGATSGQQLDRAESALRRYLATDHALPLPTAASAHYRLGMVLEKKGDKAGARGEYETAVKLEPRLKAAADALERVK